MAWTVVPTYAVGDPWTASAVNTYLRDNLNYLATTGGVIQVTATDHYFGANARGATGARVHLIGDSAAAYIIGEHSSGNGDLFVRSTGSGEVKIEVNGTDIVRTGGSAGNAVGFYGGSPTTKQTVTGSRSANAALASLLTKLAAIGLITDSSSA